MANTIGFGQAAINNTIDYGQGATDNTINWGKSQTLSPSGETNITGTPSTPSFSNVNSFSFDGVDDYFLLPSTITLPTDFSVSMWVKASTSGSVRDQVFGGASGFFLFGTVVLNGGANADKMCYNNGSSYVALTPTIRDGQWHNIVITYNSSATNLIAYTDGVETYNATYNAGTNNVIDRISEDTYGNYWNGNLDELAVWKSELSASDVTAIYNNGEPQSLDAYSPFVWFRLGDNATWNGATWTMTSVGTDTRIARSINMVEANRTTDVPTASSFTNTKSILLDGVDDYVSLASRTQNFTDFSVSVWFKTTSKGGANAIIGNSGAEGGYLFFIGQSSGVIKFYDNAYRTISGTITDNAWHHLAVTYDSSANELKSYIDNSLFTTYTPNASALGTNSHSFNQIGQRITIGQWIGNLDEIGIFSSVLSASDVSTIYGSSSPTSLASLNPVHWWRCGDGDTAPTLTDNGSGGNDGTMTNFTTFSTDVPT